MKLREYLVKKNLTIEGFAQVIGCSRQTIHNLMSGRNRPSIDLMIAIERETKRKVRIEDFIK